jgi:hypothetical protein
MRGGAVVGGGVAENKSIAAPGFSVEQFNCQLETA